VWTEGPVPPVVNPMVSVSTRYNVGNYHNLAFLLFDYNWGKREPHDLEGEKLERSFKSDGTLPPAPQGYDEDGWSLPAH
jgi:hypothetical protein